MRSSESEQGQKKGGSTFGMDTKGVPLRGGRTTTQEPPPMDTSKPTKEKGKGFKKKTGLFIAGGLALAGVGGTAIAVYQGYQVIPAIHQSVDAVGKTIDDSWNSISQGPTIEERFPIALPKENFTLVNKEEKQKLWENTKTVNPENHTLTIGFPGNLEDINKGTIRMKRYFEPTVFIGTDAEKKEAETTQPENVTQMTGFAKGKQFSFNFDSEKFDVSVFDIKTAGVNKGGFLPAYTTARFILKDKETGKEIRTAVSVLGGKWLIAPAPSPKDHDTIYAEGTPISSDTLILELTTDRQNWDGKGQVIPGEGGQIVYFSASGGPTPIAPDTKFLKPYF